MSLVRVHSFTVSVDGYGAGPGQDIENPLGVGGPELMDWLFHTRAFRETHAPGGGEVGIDNRMAERGFENIGAWILGRNMFGPVRGPWPDDGWKGWWGDDPPYHVPTFVLTHHARPSIPMAGGTTFHFVTGGVQDALQRAQSAAGDRDVRIGGGAATLRQFFEARLIDEAVIAVRPLLLGSGEPLFVGLDLRALGYACVDAIAGERATHVVLRKQ